MNGLRPLDSTRDAPRVRHLGELLPHVDYKGIIDAVERAFIESHRGLATTPPPGLLQFSDPPGDCHIKFGYLESSPNFVVKIATGFPENSAIMLPTNNGAVLVFSRRTGRLETIFLDEGWLTSWRTAAAGAIVARAFLPTSLQCIAMFGTGHQAKLQLEWLRAVTTCRRLFICGRNPQKATVLAEEATALGYRAVVASAEHALKRSRLVVTATSSEEPLFDAALVQPGTHITALGADGPGKQELSPALLSRASLIAVDSYEQCIKHGELGRVVGFLGFDSTKVTTLGAALSDPKTRRPNDITVADLTGVAFQDVAIADYFLEKLTGMRRQEEHSA